MQKTKIEWADYTWNPIKGLCPVGCWYCYARKMYQRFGWAKEISLDLRPIEYYGRIPNASKIFICSTFEMFHPDVPSHYRDFIFNTIKIYSNLIFIILTKMPERIDRPMPNNVWLGVTVAGAWEWERAKKLITSTTAKIKFVSFEPLIGLPEQSDFRYVAGELDWVIMGRLTGYGHKYDPLSETIKAIIGITQDFGVPLFMKNNLKEIWPEPLIQEFPKELFNG